MPSTPSDPKDVADMLEALARRIRGDARELSDDVDDEDDGALSVTPDDGRPSLGEVDLLTDDRSVTVTVEARNTDASHVHVSLLEGRLMIGLGEGPGATRKDVALPAAVDEDGAVATFRNGILDVVLPLKRR